MATAAAKYTHPKMYYCVENHLKSETASTDQFHMMCKGHVPVHLFESCTDQEFVKYHYDVSIFFKIFIIFNNKKQFYFKKAQVHIFSIYRKHRNIEQQITQFTSFSHVHVVVKILIEVIRWKFSVNMKNNVH